MGRRMDIVLETALFDGISIADGTAFLEELHAKEKRYARGSIIISAGERLTKMGVLTDGQGQIVREDAEGNRTILSELIPGDLFGEAYAAAETEEVPISVIAVKECYVYWISLENMLAFCAGSCSRHRQLIRNLMRVIAQKNVWMNEKMRILSCKTTREKIMTYLREYSERTQKNTFTIPFNRSELADFLGADRSAMSRELGRLRDEGYLRFEKNRFELLK